MHPHDIRGLHRLRHRHQVRRDRFDVLSARLLRQRPHEADRIVLEVGDFGRHEAEDPPLGSHDVGEQARPVAVARVNVDDGGARLYSCEPDQLGLLGLVVHRDLRSVWVYESAAVGPRYAAARARACVSIYSRIFVSLPFLTVMAKIQSSSNVLFVALIFPRATPTTKTRSPCATNSRGSVVVSIDP